jgi:hypothetical protein
LSTAFAAVYGSAERYVANGVDPRRPDDRFRVRPSALVIADTNEILISSVTSHGLSPESADGDDDGLHDAHSQFGGLAVHVFGRRDGRRGELVATAPYLEGGLGFGSAAEWTIRTDLLSTPALLVQVGFQQMGCLLDHRVLYAPLQNVGQALTTPMLVLHESPLQDLTEGKIEAVERDRSFLIRYSGGLSRAVTYKRSPSGFVADTPRDQLLSC